MEDTAARGLDAHVTRWLRDWRDGDDDAIARVTDDIYRDLRRLAGYYLSQEQKDHTLQATALVHEAFLHLGALREIDWKARGQFVATMAKVMRRILIDYARKRRAIKRGAPIAMDLSTLEVPGASVDPIDILTVDHALDQLAAAHPRHARAVELRFFGGLTAEEIATVMSLSLATVERDWRFARAFMQATLERRDE